MILRSLMILGAGLACAVPALAEDQVALDLAKKSGCLACHSLDKKLVGPAWIEVGRKYAGDAGAEAKLVAKVKKGGAGVWGTVPMPPNVTVKDADIKALVQYALSLK